jgi:hypothetical protein
VCWPITRVDKGALALHTSGWAFQNFCKRHKEHRSTAATQAPPRYDTEHAVSEVGGSLHALRYDLDTSIGLISVATLTGYCQGRLAASVLNET